jgi:hypothetical protein
MSGLMKIIAFEEHYTLPEIADAHPNSPRKLFDVSGGGSGWPAGRQFLERMPIPPADKEKIAHSNAQRLLRLPNEVSR